MTSLNSNENERVERIISGEEKKDQKLLDNEFENDNMEVKKEDEEKHPTFKEDTSDFDDYQEENYQASDFSPTTFATKAGPNGVKPEPGLQKTVTERFFSPIKEGSVRSSIFAIASVCLGMGTMAMPSAFSKISMLGGCIFLIVGACLGYWSLCILIESSRKLKTNNYSVKHISGGNV